VGTRFRFAAEPELSPRLADCPSAFRWPGGLLVCLLMIVDMLVLNKGKVTLSNCNEGECLWTAREGNEQIG
jgi:hypothetical protein